MSDILNMDGKESEPKTLVSIVVPVFNEAECIQDFIFEIESNLENSINYEIIFINDGSTDETETKIMHYLNLKKNIRLINLSRNFGKEAALMAGMRHASGDVVVPIDVDLQDPPTLIPQMLDLWRDGAKVVNARRIDRQSEPWSKRFTAVMFYKIINFLSEVNIPSNVGDFRLLDKEVVHAILSIKYTARFNKGIFSWVGFETVEINYKRRARMHGRSSWSSWQLVKLALDGIFSSSTLPLRIWTYFGVILIILATLFFSTIAASVIIFGQSVPGYASTLGIIIAFSSTNLIALGIMGEYIGRIYKEVRNEPIYIIRSMEGPETDGNRNF